MKKLFELFITFVAFAVVIAIIAVIAVSCSENENKTTKTKYQTVTTKQRETKKFEQLTQIATTTVAKKPVQTPEIETTTTQPFSHEYCQYPERWSNPPYGCDNTDPAVPECLEQSYSQEAEALCIKEYEQAHQQS